MRFASSFARLWTAQVEGLGLQPRSLPVGLAEAEGSWRGRRVTLRARAFWGLRVRYARAVALGTDDGELEIANWLCVPDPTLRLAPVLGVDLVFTGQERSVVVADLSPSSAEDESFLAGRLPVPGGPALPRTQLPQWSQRVFSTMPVFVRPTQEELPSALERVAHYERVHRECLRTSSLEPGAEADARRQRQQAYLREHREADRALRLLARIASPDFSNSFIDQVLFPERLPPFEHG